MVFKKIKKEHQTILEEWIQDDATRTHLAGMLPLNEFMPFILSVPYRQTFMVFEKDEPLGMVDIEFYPEEKTTSLSLLVNPLLRKKGIGTMLLQSTLQLSYFNNYTRLDAFIEPENIASIKCFLKNGFIQTDKIPNEDGLFLFSYFF